MAHDEYFSKMGRHQPISHRKCTGGFWYIGPPIVYNGKWGTWRAHFIEAPWLNFCHGLCTFMILSHMSSIVNVSVKKRVFLVALIQQTGIEQNRRLSKNNIQLHPAILDPTLKEIRL